MELTGLSTDQAPPISAPVRFFLTAPIFGVIAGLLMFFNDASMLVSRYSIQSITITHAITIGFLAFVMLGAMTQMLPVLAGAKILHVDTVSKYSYIFLLFGTLFLLFGLYFNNSTCKTLALIGLGSGFIILLSSIALSLKSVIKFNATVRGMALSMMFAFFIVLMGLYLLWGFIDYNLSPTHYIIANIHSTWAIFGFGVILIIGVAFQVLPMFYVAPKFKPFCKRRVAWLILTGLIFWSFFEFFYTDYEIIAKIWIALFVWAFATTVWMKLNKRKRPVSDITIWYWRVASISLTLGSFLWIFDEFFKHEYIVIVAIFIGGGFILSIMIGMMYKIIPFLVWFHLNGMGYMSIPNINEMINKKIAKTQFFLFVASLIGFVFTFYYHHFLQISALSFTLSMLLLEYNMIKPMLIYARIRKTKPEFDMSMFSIPPQGE